MVMSSTEIPILLSTLAFLTFCLLFFGVLHYYLRYTKKREMMEKIRKDYEGWEARSEESSSPKTKRSFQKLVLNFLNLLGKRVTPDASDNYSRMRIRFLRAGLRGANIPAAFWGTKIFLMIFFPSCFVLARISVFKLFNTEATLASCVFLALSGLFLPDIWLGIRTAIRKRRILEGLPDALDLLVVCVEAGMGLDAAINRVGEEVKLTNNVLSDELKILNLELRAGKSRQDALRNLAQRTDIEDLRGLVTLLIQTDKFGTRVAQALRVYSDVFRTKRYQRAEEIAAKLPVKLTFPLVLFILPSLFVVLVGPAAIRIYQTLLHH